MTTPNPTSSTGRVVLAAEGLTKRYGEHAAVEDLSFEVPSGHVAGLIGPNGAGKTTAMKMLLGLVRPTTGSAAVLGAPVGSSDFVHAVRRVGSLIEEPGLYERFTARENLALQARALGLRHAASRIDELLELVELTDRADDAPHGYSLGMKQRLGIAVALMGQPELVMLDEPANGLDPAGIVEIRRLLRRLPEMGTTVLVSSHQLSEVEQACDSLLVLAQGRLIRQGTTEDIVEPESGQRFRVTVVDEDLGRARAAVSEAGLVAESGDGPEVVVDLPTTWSGRDLNQLLVGHDVFAQELARERQSLGAAFLNLTSDINTGETTNA